jgi:hypothetical protein
MRRGGVATLVSPDGIHWDGLVNAGSMGVAADTANNALYDPHLNKYIAFSRNHCHSSACNASLWGDRRETFSTSATWGTDTWSKATEALHGEHGYEMYSVCHFACGLCRSPVDPLRSLRTHTHTHTHTHTERERERLQLCPRNSARGAKGDGLTSCPPPPPCLCSHVDSSCRTARRRGHRVCTWRWAPSMRRPTRRGACRAVSTADMALGEAGGGRGWRGGLIMGGGGGGAWCGGAWQVRAL